MQKNSLFNVNTSNINSQDKFGSHHQQSSQSALTKQRNIVEQFIYRLCSKIASVNNLNDKIKDEFINKSYAYLVKLFCSDAYTPTYDAFEISQKIKKHC
jgi:hypothetical protein